MRIPLSWVKKFIDITYSPQELSDILTLAGLEVESIESHKDDIVFDISFTPNLGHCMSVFGLARELSALLDVPLKTHAFSLRESAEPIERHAHVAIYDRKKCLRYCCRVVFDVEVGPSPQWMQERLAVAGMRSINNLVDIGNLILLEFGQPLHFFDYDCIADKRILVTSEGDHPTMETLDGVARMIPPESLLICDPAKPLAFAGVIGGKSSMVTGHTKNVLIEAAYFTPQAVRKSARLLGCRTDSSSRFDKGVDPNGVLEALNYAAALAQECAGGQVAKGVIDERVHAFSPKRLTLRSHRVNALLGTQLSLGEMATLLQRLQFDVEMGKEELAVSVPAYRHDIAIEEDLIEEVARLYGYNRIPQRPPRYRDSTLPHASVYALEQHVRHLLVREGLQEWLTCDLISPDHAALTLQATLTRENLVTVLHPRSMEQSVLRASLLPGLLLCVKHNVDHGRENFSAFEVGKIHMREGEQFKEYSTAAIVLCGRNAPFHWDPIPKASDFFDLKGILENVLSSLGVEVTLETSHMHVFHPGRQARMHCKDAFIGALGELHPELLAQWGIEHRVLFAECNLHALYPFVRTSWTLQEIPQFPGSERDLTITVKEALPVAALLDTARAQASPFLEYVSLLALYKSEQIGKDRKNVTLRFRYRDREKTIDFDTVEREHARMTRALMQQVD